MSASSHSDTTVSLAVSRPGDVIDERFRLINALGPAWRWDHCFKGRDLEREDDVILKIASLPGEPERIDALQKSAAWLSSIRHPNLAELRHFGRCGDDVYAVERWQSGPTFLQVKRRFPGIRLGHARALLAHLASGFDALIGRQWAQAFQLDLNEIIVTYEDAEQEAAWRKSDSQGWGDMHVRFSPLGKPMAGDRIDLVAIYASLVYELLGGDRDAESYEVLPNLSQEGNLLLESFLRESALPGDCGSLLRSLCEIEELPEEDVLKIALLSDEHQALGHGLSHLAELGKKLDAAKREVAASKSSLAKERAAFEAERDAFRRNLQTNTEAPSKSASWQSAKQEFDDREASLNRREEEAKQQFHALKDEVAYLKKRPREIRHSLAQTTVADAQLRGVIDNLKLQLETADTERQKLRKQVRKLESHFDPQAAFRRRLIAGSLTAAAVIVMGSLSYIWGDEAIDVFFPCRAQWQRYQADAERHFETKDWFAVLEDGKKMDDYFHQTPACKSYYDKGAPRARDRVRRALIEFANPSADPLAFSGAAPPESTRPFAYLEHLQALEAGAETSPKGAEERAYQSYVDRLITLDTLLTEAQDWQFLGDERAAHLASARVGIPLLLHQGNARAALERYVDVYGLQTVSSLTDAGRIDFPAAIVERLASVDLSSIVEPLARLEQLYGELDPADQRAAVRHDIRHILLQGRVLEGLHPGSVDWSALLKILVRETEEALLTVDEIRVTTNAVVESLLDQADAETTTSLAGELKALGKALEMPELYMVAANAYESLRHSELEQALREKRLPDVTRWDQTLFELYTEAALSGHAEGTLRMGRFCWVKDRNIDILKKLAESGDADGVYAYTDALLDMNAESAMSKEARQTLLERTEALIRQLESERPDKARFLKGLWHFHRASFLREDTEASQKEHEAVQRILKPICDERPGDFPRACRYYFLSRRLLLGEDAALEDPDYLRYRNLGAAEGDSVALYYQGVEGGDRESLLESALRGNPDARRALAENLDMMGKPPSERLPYLRPREVEKWYEDHRGLIETF